MGPVISFYILNKEQFITNTLSKIISKITKDFTTTKKAKEWTVMFENKSFDIFIKETDSEKMLEDFIAENITSSQFKIDDRIVELLISCNHKNQLINNNFARQFFDKLKEVDSVEILGITNKSEFGF